MMDLDHFKYFNDNFGHEAGDLLLKELGVLLKNNIRGEDIACRYGGEEFTLILPEGTGSGLVETTDLLRNIEGIAFVWFTEHDVVRHPLVQEIIRAYESKHPRAETGARK